MAEAEFGGHLDVLGAAIAEEVDANKVGELHGLDEDDDAESCHGVGLK